MSEQTNLINVVNDEQYVDWPSLRYYDQRIKDYIRTTSATKEETSQLQKDLDQLEELLRSLNDSFVTDKKHIYDHITECVARSATKDELNEALEDIRAEINAITGVDLSKFATTEYVDKKIAEVAVELPEGLVTEDALQEYVAEEIAKIEHPTVDLSGLATKDELSAVEAKIPSVEGLASETYVDAKVASIVIPEVPTKVSELENDAGYITAADIPEADLSNYYNKTETENLISEAVESIEHPTVDLEGYATEEWVNEQGFLKEHQDLSEYARKSDIPEAELFVVDFNAPDFAAAVEAYNNGKLLLLVNAAPDANGYAVVNYVRADLITFTKFLTSRSEAYGSFNTYYLHSDNTWEISKEVKLNKVEANVDGEVNSELTSIRIGKEVYSIPSTEGLASIEYVDNSSNNLQTSITSITETTETLQTTVTQVQEDVTQVSTQVTQLEQNVQNNYITIEDGVTKQELQTEVRTVVEQEVEVIVDEKISEVVTDGVSVSSIDYGEF